jgi:transglutaminase-like putative cysteine protease
MDYNAPAFQQWLTANGLRKKSGEGDIDFAWRAFSFIKARYFYHFDPKQDRAASKLCQTDNSDCGGLSGLFISALRANGVPARNLTGRVALTAGSNDQGQHHVEADFFADGIGWVPVNIAPAAGNAKRSPYMDFARFNGDFLAFHADGGMVFDTLWFGKPTVDGEQGVYHSVRGSGNFDGATDTEDWQVTSSHL